MSGSLVAVEGARRCLPADAAAMTVGFIVISRGPVVGATLRHERAHARQWAVLGPLFVVIYLGEYCVRRTLGASRREAYRALLLERLARRAEDG